MKTLLQKIVNRVSVAAVGIFVATMVALGASASAAQIPYNPNGNSDAPSTPAFNIYTGVPSGTGDESDFVRVKPKAGGNGDYVDTLNSSCNIGDSFNVRTYIHNGATDKLNDNGNGSAVAHNVYAQLKAELGNPNTKFKFESTVNATNAASKTDTGYLNCNGKTVKLSLVHNSVQTYSKPIGFFNEDDSLVNGNPFKIGSRAHASGDQWGCWDDRIIITYEVKIEEVPVVVPSNAICKLENGAFVVVDQDKRTVKGRIKPELTNATVSSYKIDWGDGTSSNKQSDTHTYAKDGQYNIQASFVAQLRDGPKTITGSDCKTVVKFEAGKPPVVVTTTPTPTKLTSTGPASTFSIFAVTSIIGAVLHRMYTARKATQE
jgi:hypothetical protein